MKKGFIAVLGVAIVVCSAWAYATICNNYGCSAQVCMPPGCDECIFANGCQCKPVQTGLPTQCCGISENIVGSSCTSDYQCCGGANGYSHCQSSKCCSDVPGYCRNTADCCSGHACNLSTNTCCYAVGQTNGWGDPTACCTGIQVGGVCCKNTGGCSNGLQCCSGVCLANGMCK